MEGKLKEETPVLLDKNEKISRSYEDVDVVIPLPLAQLVVVSIEEILRGGDNLRTSFYTSESMTF